MVNAWSAWTPAPSPDKTEGSQVEQTLTRIEPLQTGTLRQVMPVAFASGSGWPGPTRLNGCCQAAWFQCRLTGILIAAASDRHRPKPEVRTDFLTASNRSVPGVVWPQSRPKSGKPLPNLPRPHGSCGARDMRADTEV